ncbi:MAG: hypothetical protein GXO49_05765 [Chlorobi bacterium]|nr:hypothetical protein [Chlorobiota bacterium]
MKKFSTTILVITFIFSMVSCSSSQENTEEKGKKIAESLIEGLIEQSAKEDGKDIDVDIDLDKIDEDGGVMTIKDENGEEVTISSEEGKLTITGENGEEVIIKGDENKIPESLPSDVYVVKGEVESAGTMKSGEGELITFTIKSKEEFNDVISKISKEMQANGWKSTMNMNMGGESMQIFTKEDNSATITSQKKEDYTNVAYMVTVKIKQ